MDLMTLAAKIQLDDSEFNKGVNNAERLGQGLASKMSAWTVAVGNLAADMIRKGISAITSVVSGSINEYANFEQLIGGVETLFKLSSNKVYEYAKKSFKTTGLSANDYMETVTSFSAALLQGLGGDTEKAADMADMAITDMADNANKMGTDISAIQSAYQGFAKQNFNMLDNLKLGYGGTREEMVRLINDSGILNEKIEDLNGITFDQIVMAIHEIQTQMGITGTTAKEAEQTISGSAATMKAAWSDMLSAMAGEGDQERLDETFENFKTSFSQYMENVIPALIESISNSGGLVGAIAEAITSLPDTLLADLGKAATESGADTIRGVGKIANWLIDSIINVFKDVAADNSAAQDLGNAIGDMIGTAISHIVTNVGSIFEGAVSLGYGLASGLLEGLMAGLFGTGSDSIAGIIAQSDRDLAEGIREAESNSARAEGIISYLEGLANKYGEAAKNTKEWKDAMADLDGAIPGIGDWAEAQEGTINNLIGAMDNYIAKQKELAIETAKQNALQSKYEAWMTAVAELQGAQAEIEMQRDIGKASRKNLVDYIADVSGDKSFTGEGMTAKQLETAAYSSLNEKYKNGRGDIGYNEDEARIKAWTTNLSESESAISELSGSLQGLENNVTIAETAYLTSAAALDDVAGSASGAADALAAIKTPSITFSGGAYANWFYGGGSYTPHANGMETVPFSGYKAELHRGEMVLTKAQADRYRDGGGTAEVVSAIMSLGNDLQNMQLVVGRKTFGRAVVGYGGNRMNGYIGRAESRRHSGYGS